MYALLVAAFALLVRSCVAEGGFGQGGFQGPQGAYAPPGYTTQQGHYDHFAHLGFGGPFGSGVLAGFLDFGITAGTAVIFGSLMLLVFGLVIDGLMNLAGVFTPVLNNAQDIFGSRKIVGLYQNGAFGDIPQLAYQVLKAVHEREKQDKQPE